MSSNENNSPTPSSHLDCISPNIQHDLLRYQTLHFEKEAIESNIHLLIMKMETIDEIKAFSKYVLAGSDLDKSIKSRIDFLEGKPSAYELYITALAKEIAQ